MLLVIIGLVALLTVILSSRLRMPVAHSASLGWMSERWLAEYRASHLT